MEEQTAPLVVKEPKALQVWAFALSVWSIVFVLVPILNLGPAIVAIVLSAKARKRSKLKKLSTAALILSIVATVGTAQVTFSFFSSTVGNKIQPCLEVEKALEPISQSMGLLKESIRLQNLTGVSDKDGTRRLLMVVQADADELLKVDGPAEFISIRDEIHLNESKLFQQMGAALEGNMDNVAAQAAEDATINALSKLTAYCD